MTTNGYAVLGSPGTAQTWDNALGGAREYWLVSPEKREIEVYKNSERGFQPVKVFTSSEELNTPLFPDIHLQVGQIFD